MQKIAVPGSGSAVPISTLVMVGSALFLWMTRAVVITRSGAIFYALLVSVTGICILVNGSWYLSVSSWLLFCGIHFPYIMRLRGDDVIYEKLINFFIHLMMLISVIGVAQFLLQFVIGANLAFFLDYNIPAIIFMEGYNNVIPLQYGSHIFKSNGFFLLEPSFFSLFLAFAFLAEVSTGGRIFRLAILFAGLIVSYSGSGLLILAIFLPIIAFKQKLFKLIIFGVFVLILMVIFGEALQLDLFQNRISEINRPGSSAYGRFISIFFLLDQFVFSSLQSTFFGRGPGSVTEYLKWLPFEAHDPTWGKVVYEYGLFGAIAYFSFIFTAIRPATDHMLRMPLLIALLFSGGYLLTPFVHSFIIIFVVWTAYQKFPRQKTQRNTVEELIPKNLAV